MPPSRRRVLGTLIGTPLLSALPVRSELPAAEVATPAAGVVRRLQVVATRGQLPVEIEGGGDERRTRMESQLVARVGRHAAFDIQLVYANFHARQSREAPGPSDFVLSAALLREPFGPPIPLTFGTSLNPVVSRGAGLILSNPLGVDLEPNSDLVIRSGALVARSGLVPCGMRMKAPGDRMVTSAAERSQVYADGQFAFPEGGAIAELGFGPTAILGVFERPAPSFLIWGDSLGWGRGDGDDQNGNSGLYERGLWRVYPDGSPAPYVNMSRSGDQLASNVPMLAPLKRGLISYVSHVVVALGTNDISVGRELEAIKEDARAIWRSVRRHGAKVVAVKILPKTRTGANREIFSDAYRPGGVRDLYTAWLDTRVGIDVDHVLDPNLVLESRHDPGFWVASDVSVDGLHLTAKGAAMGAEIVRAFAATCTV
jgi:lysophospholipase L1-like esterase